MLKKMIILSLVISLSFLFSGCSSKKEVVIVHKDKFICTPQTVFNQPKLNIYIAKEDYENAKQYKKVNDLAYKNYKDQVKRNNKLCEKFKNKLNK